MLGEDAGERSKESPETFNVSTTEPIGEFQAKEEFSSPGFDFQWGEDTSLGQNVDWRPEDLGTTAESPGIWDPSAFEQQAPNSWRETKEPKRIQDIKSPLLVEIEPEQLRSNSDEDEWPFKSPCKMEEKKKKKKMTAKTDAGASDIDSENEESPMTSNGDKFGSGAGGDSMPATVRHTVSTDGDEDNDIEEDAEIESSTKKKRSSSHSSSKSSKEKSSRRASKKDREPNVPSRGSRPDADEEEMDQPPTKPGKAHRRSSNAESDQEDVEDESSGKGKKPKRRGTKSEVVGEGEDGLNQGSFHNLAKDFDKKPPRSSSKTRTSKVRAPGSAGSSARRRRVKEKGGMDTSGHSGSTFDDDVEEFGEEEHEVKLKGDADGTPGRRRRSQGTRVSKEGQQVLQAPGSAGRRPPSARRGQVKRSSSERWNRAVEGIEGEDDEEGGDPDQELSRSAHVVRRYHSGGVGRMAAGLGSASYHGTEGARVRTPNRRPPRRPVQTPNSDGSGGGSFGGDDYEYELNLSGRSARTLDSIEDLEDFEHIDFQTPGFVDYDEEIFELMQKANPEHTAHLQRRVQRKRDAVNYDQNMPMMTRQALMTRTASTQVQRQFVDQSTIDKRRMLVRSMSNSSMASNDELSMSQHRQQFARAGPSRRPPPRTRSSGMAALSRSEHPHHSGRPGAAEEDRRRVFRTKSGASTSSFRQNQKPNRVQSVNTRRADGGGGLESARKGPPDERKGSLARAQSMHATVGRTLSPKKPERRPPTTIEARKSAAREKEDDESSSVSEDSDVESDEDEALVSPRRKIPIKVVPKVAPTPPKTKTDKRDFSIKRNRCKLHSMLYDLRMGVDMKELLNTVQQGEVTRSPIHTLMMPSP